LVVDIAQQRRPSGDRKKETEIQMIQINEGVLFLVILILVPVALSILQIEKRVSALYRIEAKLDLLMKQAGIDYTPGQDLSDAVRDAIQRGRKIEAIKLYRQATGVGLKEAKDTVEAAERGMKAP